MERISHLEAIINSLSWKERHDFEIEVTSAFFNPKWLKSHDLIYPNIKLEDVKQYVLMEMYPQMIKYASQEILLQQSAS